MAHEQETQCERKKKVEIELAKGKQIATRLKTLLQNTVGDPEPILYDDLAMQILTSFNNTITLLTSSPELLHNSQAAVDGGGSSCSAESVKKVKDRRGCYKRRKSSDSWTTVTKTMEDGLAWRKYGQKEIQNSTYPRCYFRCTNKHQGCKAIKQVQRLRDDPFLYQTTYFNHHTCCIHNTLRPPHDFIVLPDPVHPDVLSFQQLSNPVNNVSAQVKEETHGVKVESKEDTESDPWKDILVAGSDDCWFGYKPLWGTRYEKEVGSGFDSCVSTSGHDMEVNQHNHFRF